MLAIDELMHKNHVVLIFSSASTSGATAGGHQQHVGFSISATLSDPNKSSKIQWTLPLT